MRHFNQGRFSQQMNSLRRQFGQSEEFPFSDLLSSAGMREALEEAQVVVVDCIYTPLTTLLVFLWQALSADSSCRAAVAKLVAHRAARGQRACSAKTGAYCIARKQLPEQVFSRMARQVAGGLVRSAPIKWFWKKRDVKLFDGSTVSMPDTPANQREYPQAPNQRPGVGFPIARIAAVFSLASGAVLDLAICKYRGKGQSELGLLRTLMPVFAAGDVLLTDRYLCSWCELALLRERGVDFVARLHQARSCDFRRGERLGPDDHLVSWRKPEKPEWMEQVVYDRLPAEMAVREARFQVHVPGFRPKWIVIATSLLDATDVSREDLSDLFRQRWHAELDLRSLKETLRMDVLRCKTPELVRKEIWTHLLAYNLVRTIMAQAAVRQGIPPRTISFKGTLQTLTAFQPHLEAASAAEAAELHRSLLAAIAAHLVGDRPDRYEPRVKKRRPKSYQLLTQPRAEARKALLQ